MTFVFARFSVDTLSHDAAEAWAAGQRQRMASADKNEVVRCIRVITPLNYGGSVAPGAETVNSGISTRDSGSGTRDPGFGIRFEVLALGGDGNPDDTASIDLMP